MKKQETLIYKVNTKSVKQQIETTMFRIKLAKPFLWIAAKIMNTRITVEYEITQVEE